MLTSLKSAPVKSTPVKFAPLKSDLLKSALCRLTPCRFLPLRLAPGLISVSAATGLLVESLLPQLPPKTRKQSVFLLTLG